MELTLQSLKQHRQEFLDAGYSLPEFDYDKVMENTRKNPTWVHFGAGNIFRAFQANVVQKLLNSGEIDTGLIAAEGFDYEIVEKMYWPHDNLGILATLKADNTVDKTIVGSIMESLVLDSENEEQYGRLKEIFANPSLQMASFTITEKGYSLVDGKGNIVPAVEADFVNGPKKPASYLGKVVSLLYTRYESGKLPIAMVSMDNCSHNGDKLAAAVFAFADKWVENGVAEKDFAEYVRDAKAVSFPWSMIDKITPRPDAKIEKILKDDGIEQLEPVITSKNTYVAPFVNAEECQYLVIEDNFPNGRPELEKGGLYFTDRETVDKVEKMKVCTCLNPLHTFLAVSGCLLGYTLIADEMKDDDLLRLVKKLGYDEGLPVVVDPKIISPKTFIDEVVNMRIPNPFMPDTPQRIACDTSQKLSIRFGETIKAYIRDGLDVNKLQVVPLVFALWIRYLMAINDKGDAFELSPDPLLAECSKYVSEIKLGDSDAASKIDALLSRKDIFGVDLFEVGLSEKVKDYFAKLSCKVGAVREVLQSIKQNINRLKKIHFIFGLEYEKIFG